MSRKILSMSLCSMTLFRAGSIKVSADNVTPDQKACQKHLPCLILEFLKRFP